jgi:hypothetical protein
MEEIIIGLIQLIQSLTEKPFLFVYITSISIVAYALYVIFQITKNGSSER